jgi:two-component system, LytTR family, response regulator
MNWDVLLPNSLTNYCISIEELIVAVNKVQEHLISRDSINRNQVLLENFKEKRTGKQQLILPTLEGFEVVKIENILRLKGNGNFTDVYLQDGSKKMVCRFLKHFEELLPAPFLRVHKTHLINLDFVTAYHKGSGGYVSMSDGAEVEISPNYKEVFLGQFK